jgi:hypothetical protein
MRVGGFVLVAAVLCLFGLPAPRVRAAVPGDPPELPLAAFLAMAELSYVPPEILVRAAPNREFYYLTRDKRDEFKQAEEYFAKYAAGFEVLRANDVPENIRLAEFMADHEPYASLFRRKGESGDVYVLAFRGTKTVGDWLVDFAGGLGFVPGYYEQGNRLAGRLLAWLRPEDSLVLTGHSLGGGIAEYAASQHGLVAVTFNSAHLSHRFPVRSDAAVYTYHVVGRSSFLSNDIVNVARLGGNFEQTVITSIPVGSGIIINPHYIARYYEWREWQTQPLPTRRLRTGFDPDRPLPGSTLLESMPTLVADAPPLVREAIRRKDVDDSPLFTSDPLHNGLVHIWDVRFRVSRLYDSYPSGGLPDEDLRMLVPPSTTPIAADFATAFELQSAFSHPFSRRYSFIAWGDRRVLNYHQERAQDFSLSALGAALVHIDRAGKATWSLGGKYQRFKSVAGNQGQIGAVEFAGSWQPAADRWLVWTDASVGALRKAGVGGGNGTVVDTNAGIRYQVKRSQAIEPTTNLPRRQLVAQLRTFDAWRTSDVARFANSQWGAGLSLTYQGRYFRAFLEPSLRFTRHHLDPSPLDAARKFSDHEVIVRAELAWAGRVPLGDVKIVGWEFAVGYMNDASDTIEEVRRPDVRGDYRRYLIGGQLSKRF